MKFSVLISVYAKDNAHYFSEALQSLCDSSIVPDEVILICDGPLTTALESIIYSYQLKLPLKIIKLKSNQGLGLALRQGLRYCQYEWVARFDADDICCRDRFEKQLKLLEQCPGIDVLGGQIIEFTDIIEEDNVVKKTVPFEHEQITAYAKLRNPINHMTVMFKKSSVLEVGNYQNAPLYEDYDLWIRMLLKGYTFANLEDVLVLARAGKNMYERRGNLSYARQEIKMQYKFYKIGFLSSFELVRNLLIRIPVRLIPNGLRSLIYTNLLRQ